MNNIEYGRWERERLPQGTAQPQPVAHAQSVNGLAERPNAGDGQGHGIGTDQAERLFIQVGQPGHDKLTRVRLHSQIEHQRADLRALTERFDDAGHPWQARPHGAVRPIRSR